MTLPEYTLREAKELCERATHVAKDVRASSHGTLSDGTDNPNWFVSGLGSLASHLTKEVATFVAASFTLVPRLIAEVERLTAELTTYRETEGTSAICFEKVVADRDKARAEVERMTAMYWQAMREVETMRKVWNAAREWHSWRGSDDLESVAEEAEALWNAIDAALSPSPAEGT